MIRAATPADVPAIVAMVHELAAYERSADQCTLTEAQLHAALFAEAPALFGHVALADEGPDAGAPVGFALWFLNFSTWEGSHGIYLEDLYVKPHARGGGHGRALLQTLAAIAIERGYRRVEWWVLDWNEPALGFYRRIGAVPMEEWTVHRLTGAALDSFAAGQRTAL